MKRLTFFSILVFAIASIAIAQDQDFDESDVDEWARGAQMVPTKSTTDVEGTPFYNKEWQTGHIFLRSGNKSEALPLKYNAYTNELLFQKDGEILAVIPRQVKGFVLLPNNRQTVFKNGFQSEEYDIPPSQFFRVVYDGNTKLLVKHHTKLHERRDILGGGNRIIKYIPKKDYYLVSANGKWHDIKLKEKDILKALGNHKKQLEQYAETENIDFGDEADAATLLSYYESLEAGEK